MTSAAELKKPPLAPKPKLVGTNNKPPPPPIAPKPDIGSASVPRLTKKTKPAIAPKPKVPTNSVVQDIKHPPSKKPTLNLEEREPELPESTGKSNCKDVRDPHSDYILPTCSCSSGCIHEPRTRETLCVEQLVLEPLGMKENLENSKNGESSKRGSSWDSSSEKCRGQSGVVLKASILEEKRSKPTKAHSAENCSLESQKVKSWGQSSAVNGQRAESLDDRILSRHTSCTGDFGPEYENVRHYEEIPEYENLPFVMAGRNTPDLGWQNSSSVEDTDASLYEVEEPYNAPDGQLQLDPRHQPCSSGTSQEGQDALHLGLSDLPSDEEVINSSDEDDVSSESSKGEPDPLEDKQDEDAGMKSKVHHIAKEIMSSEKVFVDVLKLLHILLLTWLPPSSLNSSIRIKTSG